MPKRAFAGATRLLLIGAALYLAGCNSLLDVQEAGPHPPVVSNLELTPTILRSGEAIDKSFSWSDAGADISYCITHDAMSGKRYELSETDTDDSGNTVYNFPGTSGVVESSLEFEGTLLGEHHLTMWCIDKEGSISNVLEADVTINP